MPYLLSYDQEQEFNRLIAHFWIPLFFSSVIFYMNYFVFIDQFLFSKKMLNFILLNAAMIIFFLVLKEFIEESYFQELAIKRTNNLTKGLGPPFKMFIYIQSLSYMAPLLCSIAIKSTNRWVKTEADRKEASNMKLKSELQHLHYQLQPHFFFNALNNSPGQSTNICFSMSTNFSFIS